MAIAIALFSILYAALASGCPAWYLEVGGQCECNDETIMFVVLCNQGEKSIGIHMGSCVTFDYDRQFMVYAKCPYLYSTNTTNRLYSSLPSDPTQIDEAICGLYNRQGLLCGNCIKGFGPAVYSTNLHCANCSDISMGYAISLFLFIKLVPITILCFFIVIFHFNITQGPLLGYIIFFQVSVYELQWNACLYDSILLHLSQPLLALFYFSIVVGDMWNLHFFRFVLPSFCLSERMTGIHVHALNLFTAIYPVLLMIITYIAAELYAKNFKIIQFLWKPFGICFAKFKANWSVGDSVIHAFATLIMLSSFALMYETYALTASVSVRNASGTFSKALLYFDPTVVAYSTEHIPYAIVAVLLCFLLAFIPAILLCLYPTRCYEKLSRCCSPRKRIAVKIFVEALHSCFKNGLGGTRDYRILAGVTFAPLAWYFVVEYPIRKLLPFQTNIVLCFLFFILSFILSYIRPCKSLIMNLSLSFHALLYGMVFVIRELWYGDLSYKTETLAVMFVILPTTSHIYILLWAVYKMTNCCRNHIRAVLLMFHRAARSLCGT